MRKKITFETQSLVAQSTIAQILSERKNPYIDETSRTPITKLYDVIIQCGISAGALAQGCALVAMGLDRETVDLIDEIDRTVVSRLKEPYAMIFVQCMAEYEKRWRDNKRPIAA